MGDSGHYVWEGMTFLVAILVATALLVLRRKAAGRPAFTSDDRQLFFGPSRVVVSAGRFYFNFVIAIFLCSLAIPLEQLILGRFGAGVLALAQLLTLLAIVRKSLF
jgi:membrane protein CcdC involved in cytochrome C biogenesis